MKGTTRERSDLISRASWLVVGLVLMVLASALVLVTIHLRKALRSQIIQQDGLALYAASMVPSSITEELPDEVANEPEVRFAETTDKVIEAALRHDEMMGVIFFDRNGTLQLSIGGDESGLDAEQLARLEEGNTISSFEPHADLRKFLQASDKREPLIRTIVPLLKDGEFIGAAEFILDGHKVAAALAKLDHDLWLYSGLIFLFAGGITSAGLLWAFQRLERTLGLLEERTRSLLRANHELTLSAKTSAIGAITAHLIHDLKNPLFGLQSFVTARGSTEEEDWNIAQSTTERMQKVIGEIVRILQEEKTTEKYELSLEELFSLLRAKLDPQCAAAGILFNTGCGASGSLMNRDANIILLIVTNIVQNAIQATPRGGQIAVYAIEQPDCILFQMRDTGPGLPEHIRATLFTPSTSTKSGGSGLGLAISKQLANHIGADLVLKESSGKGTTFELRVPDRVLMAELV